MFAVLSPAAKLRDKVFTSPTGGGCVWQRTFSSCGHQPGDKSFLSQSLFAGSIRLARFCVAIMQNMIFDSVFEVDSVLENKSYF